jgi:flavin-dependent dehydrogenase
VDTLTKVKVNSKNQSTKIDQHEYLVCRTKFDNHFANLAKQAGAKIHLSHTFIGKEENISHSNSNTSTKPTIIIKNTKDNITIKQTPDIIIGAAGPLSPIAKAFNFYEKSRENYFGIQAIVEGQFEQGLIDTYFSKDICPGLFAWIVSESKTTARVGVATKSNSKHYFDKFLKQNHFKAKEIQAGIIPIYNPKQKLNQDNIYLVGDSSTFVKATTLGGLIPGLMQAKALATSINTNQDYKKLCKPIIRKLKTHLQIRKILDNFSDKDFNYMIKLTSQPRIKKVLQKHTRENPLSLLMELAIKEPRFAYFVKNLI